MSFLCIRFGLPLPQRTILFNYIQHLTTTCHTLTWHQARQAIKIYESSPVWYFHVPGTNIPSPCFLLRHDSQICGWGTLAAASSGMLTLRVHNKPEQSDNLFQHLKGVKPMLLSYNWDYPSWGWADTSRIPGRLIRGEKIQARASGIGKAYFLISQSLCCSSKAYV
jgi:hypothetical protein